MNSTWDFIDIYGKFKTSFQFQDIGNPSDHLKFDKFYPVKRNDKWGLMDKDLNIYKKRCDQYLKTYEHICESAVGCLHISQIDEHKAPDIYLEIYKDSYQEILNRSINESCIFLDCVVDSQDKQAL